MSNDILEMGLNRGANIAVLSIRSCDKSHESLMNAAEASERFVHSAGILPEKEFLGWQINADKEGNHQVFAFSGPGVKVTQKDFNWIFQKCASVEATSRRPLEDMGWEDRRTYALRYMPGNSGARNGSGHRSRSKQETDAGMNYYYRDFLEMTGEIGAAIRITASAGYGGAGKILISMPDEMPMRMRAMLSLVFPDAEAIEMKVSDDTWDDPGRFSAEYLAEVMTELLRVLMLERPKQERIAECDEDTLPRFEQETEGDQIPIDELNLSIRSYNCLMRAGIRTVGDLRALTEEDLIHIRNLGRKSTEEIRRKLAELGNLSALIPLTAPNYSDMLEELIGLERVKEQVGQITALAKMKQDMAALGVASVPVVLNMEFVGNPGTAKTTVARILAGIFHEIGLLPGSELVEVGRADLVAQHVGHTAEKVRSVFRQAKGKLLFVDEAYSLMDDRAGSFGDEAINTIVQEMENNREDTIVIFAGYPDQMEAFFARNPGLRSRVPFQISFVDYSTDEMVQIAELEAKRRGFAICPEAHKMVASICAAAVRRPEMGNGRFCRNLVESAILSYASRVYGNGDAAADKDFTLTDADFSVPEILREEKKTPRIGFVA